MPNEFPCVCFDDTVNTTDSKLILGLDVGGTKSAAIVGDAAGRIIDRTEQPSDAQRGPQAMIDMLCNHAEMLIARHGGTDRFRGVGVSIGGPLDCEQGIVHSPPNLPGWDAIDLRQIVSARLGLPVAVEHDAAACCLAEYHWGAGRGATRLMYLTCGTGFGVGIVIDGLAYHGARGRSIEIGHIRYRDSGPTAFGKVGSFEAFAAGASLPKLAGWRYPQRWADAPPDGRQLNELAGTGDADAQDILRLNAQAVGDACALLGDLLMPDMIILGSMAKYLGEPWIAQVRDRFALECLADVAAHCRLAQPALGNRLQDCSALVVGLRL